MRTQPQDQTGLREVTGNVTAAGAVAGGTGFTVTKTGTGAYTVYFTPPFRAVVSVTGAPAAAGSMSPSNYGPSGGVGRSMNVNTANAAGTATDGAFGFTAKGI